MAGLLSNGGVGTVFTGHFHANDITQGTPSTSARALFDIETGSAVTYPCPYRVVDVSDDSLGIATGIGGASTTAPVATGGAASGERDGLNRCRCTRGALESIEQVYGITESG